jgi:hypothetical protein
MAGNGDRREQMVFSFFHRSLLNIAIHSHITVFPRNDMNV